MRTKFARAPIVALAALALGAAAAIAANASDPGVTPDVRPARRHGAADGLRVRVRVGRTRRRCLLPVPERPWRGGGSPDHLQGSRRRLQPGADGAGDASARGAGQGVRDLQRARHRARTSPSRDYLKAQGCRSCSSPPAQRRSAPMSTSTRGRSAFSRAIKPRASIYGQYLARTRPGSKVAVLFQNDDYGKDLLARAQARARRARRRR